MVYDHPETKTANSFVTARWCIRLVRRPSSGNSFLTERLPSRGSGREGQGPVRSHVGQRQQIPPVRNTQRVGCLPLPYPFESPRVAAVCCVNAPSQRRNGAVHAMRGTDCVRSGGGKHEHRVRAPQTFRYSSARALTPGLVPREPDLPHCPKTVDSEPNRASFHNSSPDRSFLTDMLCPVQNTDVMVLLPHDLLGDGFMLQAGFPF